MKLVECGSDQQRCGLVRNDLQAGSLICKELSRWTGAYVGPHDKDWTWCLQTVSKDFERKSKDKLRSVPCRQISATVLHNEVLL